MELVPFDWQGMRVRTVLREGAPWFVAADVCAVLGHSNPTVALRRLDEDEKAVVDPKRWLGSSVSGGGAQTINVVSESGLYALVLRSRLPSARAFRRWVTGEVLPALRQRGVYALPGAAADPLRLSPADRGLAFRLLAGVEAERLGPPVWAAQPRLAPDWVRAQTLRRAAALGDQDAARALGLAADAAAAVPARTLARWRAAAAAGGLAGLMPRPRGRPALAPIPADVWERAMAAWARGASLAAACRAGLAGAGPGVPSARTLRRRLEAAIALARRAGGKVTPT